MVSSTWKYIVGRGGLIYELRMKHFTFRGVYVIMNENSGIHKLMYPIFCIRAEIRVQTTTVFKNNPIRVSTQLPTQFIIY